jgi:hypothetical protein
VNNLLRLGLAGPRQAALRAVRGIGVRGTGRKAAQENTEHLYDYASAHRLVNITTRVSSRPITLARALTLFFSQSPLQTQELIKLLRSIDLFYVSIPFMPRPCSLFHHARLPCLLRPQVIYFAHDINFHIPCISDCGGGGVRSTLRTPRPLSGHRGQGATFHASLRCSPPPRMNNLQTCMSNSSSTRIVRRHFEWQISKISLCHHARRTLVAAQTTCRSKGSRCSYRIK